MFQQEITSIIILQNNTHLPYPIIQYNFFVIISVKSDLSFVAPLTREELHGGNTA